MLKIAKDVLRLLWTANRSACPCRNEVCSDCYPKAASSVLAAQCHGVTTQLRQRHCAGGCACRAGWKYIDTTNNDKVYGPYNDCQNPVESWVRPW